jgi:hypothetical protein
MFALNTVRLFALNTVRQFALNTVRLNPDTLTLHQQTTNKPNCL